MVSVTLWVANIEFLAFEFFNIEFGLKWFKKVKKKEKLKVKLKNWFFHRNWKWGKFFFHLWTLFYFLKVFVPFSSKIIKINQKLIFAIQKGTHKDFLSHFEDFCVTFKKRINSESCSRGCSKKTPAKYLIFSPPPVRYSPFLWNLLLLPKMWSSFSYSPLVRSTLIN